RVSNRLRESEGASGFGSNVSMGLGPPVKNRKMQERARATGRSLPYVCARASAASRCGSDNPIRPRLPTRSHSRRFGKDGSCKREGWHGFMAEFRGQVGRGEPAAGERALVVIIMANAGRQDKDKVSRLRQKRGKLPKLGRL